MRGLGLTLYTTLTIVIAIDCANYLFMLIFDWQEGKEKNSELMFRMRTGFILIPDFLFQVPYLILFWCLLKAMSEGIINLGGDFYIPT